MESLRATDLDDAVERQAGRDFGDRRGYIFGRNGLDKHWWHADLVPICSRIGDLRDEFEKLRGMEDRIGNPGVFNEHLLRKLCAHVSALLEAICSHDRQGHVMP